MSCIARIMTGAGRWEPLWSILDWWLRVLLFKSPPCKCAFRVSWLSSKFTFHLGGDMRRFAPPVASWLHFIHPFTISKGFPFKK